MRSLAAFVGLLALAAVAPGAAAAAGSAEPKLDVPPAKLRASLHCQSAVQNAKRTPILLVTGTGVDGHEAWPLGLQASLTLAHRPSCYLDFPEHTTGDIQVAAEYLVHAIRATARRAGRSIAIYGVSQGGLLPRWALTYWPSLRPLVSDVVAVAGTQHGTTVSKALFAACGSSCRVVAAVWQQNAGSNFQRALARYPDETPGNTGWTTVRTLTDEIVRPTGGRHATSALQGAANLVIQRVCPGRIVGHVGSAIDSVSYAALIDAVNHPGPAEARRISRGVCGHPCPPGLDEATTAAGTAALSSIALSRTLLGADGVELLSSEPPVRRYALKR